MPTELAREQMIEQQVRALDVLDERVLSTLRQVPRELFVPANVKYLAFADTEIPLLHGQHMLRPSLVGKILQALELQGTERVLEVGTGSGYQAAVLAELASDVFSVERIEGLAESACQRLTGLGYRERIHVHAGDGGLGWAAAAPFDAIVVTAAVHSVPRPLIEQLADGGALVLPLGDADLQGLARIRRQASGLHVDYFGECRFVKLIGESGWEE